MAPHIEGEPGQEIEEREPRLSEYQYFHEAWCLANLTAEERAVCARNGIELPTGESGTSPNWWGDWRAHLRHRLTDSDVPEFLTLFPRYRTDEEALRQYLRSYDLSLLPLNLLQPEGVEKFLPRPGLVHEADPYGVLRASSVILRREGDRTYYLATHKPGYGSLLPILGHGAGRVNCPVGCAGCYRGPQTRLGKPLRLQYESGISEEVWIPAPEQQTKWLVEEWNVNPRLEGVSDILFSGGEPMMLPNKRWAGMMRELESARYLRSFRICTGALFLGLPFRFDDGFVRLLAEFRERTGVQTKLSVHVSHPQHITPESIHVARQLLRAGIELLPQTPLEPGVNVWPSDLERTVRTLRELDRRLSFVVGTRPYKWILDMQGGVSLLTGIEIWRQLHDRHQGESDITRPTSCALFLSQATGNLNLSYHTLWAMEMEIDRENQCVRYRIPHPAGTLVEYKEPIWPGINDDPERLEELRR